MASNNTTTNAASQQPTSDSKASGGQEQRFNILPHPAKTNDPADLQQPSEETGGLQSSQGAYSAFQTPGPVKLNPENLKDLPPPKTKEELSTLQAQLNK
ncbi:hypothetical protein Agabi119p4_10932 [Agaricus bisporus var. burnettii]|uniref:Uncharacterized protein n=2 Tax=Agaricus bisporus TaxID=5341 RepID=A0A8H7EVP7_AGABI|nr:hypothetical protein Agabi119p4_10932 [Agaricus bisporus var. burnettii]